MFALFGSSSSVVVWFDVAVELWRRASDGENEDEEGCVVTSILHITSPRSGTTVVGLGWTG